MIQTIVTPSMPKQTEGSGEILTVPEEIKYLPVMLEEDAFGQAVLQGLFGRVQEYDGKIGWDALLAICSQKEKPVYFKITDASDPFSNNALVGGIIRVFGIIDIEEGMEGISLEYYGVDEAFYNGNYTVHAQSYIMKRLDSGLYSAGKALMGIELTTDKFESLNFLNQMQDYTTVITLSNLPVIYPTIYATISSNQTISIDGSIPSNKYRVPTVHVYLYNNSSADRTITIPTTGNYYSMSGSSKSIPADGRLEISFHWDARSSKYIIAALEQE